MGNVLISVFSILTESLFMTGILYKTKNFNKGFYKHYITFIIVYLLCGIITSFNYYLQVWFFIIFNIVFYTILKILYKKEIIIIDFFIIGYIGFVLTLMSLGTAWLEYRFGLSILTSLIINRLILGLIYLFIRKILNKLYKSYKKLWNRRNDVSIKAITIRNITLITINVCLYVLSIVLNYSLYY